MIYGTTLFPQYEINFSRVWAMPNKATFKIKPIQKLLKEYVGDGKNWIDPFAGENSPAEITNDLNPEKPTTYHLYAHEFAEQLQGKYYGVLFDPPYNLTQIKRCYDNIGADYPTDWDLDASFGKVKDILQNKIVKNGIAISFGWSSQGFGKSRGFEIEEIMLVPHGGHHYDTIVTVERKVRFVNKKKEIP